MKTILSAVTALAIIAGSTAAFADSGDGPQFGVPQPIPATGSAVTEIATASPLAFNTGNERPADFDGQPALVSNSQVALLPADGNEGILQTANSAPVGFENGTLSMLTAQAAHEAPFIGAVTVR